MRKEEMEIFVSPDASFTMVIFLANAKAVPDGKSIF